MDDRIALAAAENSLAGTIAAMRTGLQTSFTETADPELEPALQALAGGRDLQALAHAATPALDALLVTRIDTFSAARLRVALFVVLGALVALFLFIGFFVSTRRGVRDISDRLSSLRDNCSADLSNALRRMTDGDLTVAGHAASRRRSPTSHATNSARWPSRSTRSARAPSGRSSPTTRCASRSPS